MAKKIHTKHSLSFLMKAFNKHRLMLLLLNIPILIFCFNFLQTGNLLSGGDADYLMQTQEAARQSILKFKQFPWWNPWVSGGVPLFANPQYGLLSIQSLTTLIFGSIWGYKLALVLYFIIGFWGFLLLFRKALKTPLSTAILLSYIWTFGSFLVHRSSGHYTFFTIQFFPITLYFFLRRKELRHSWLWLGLALALMANTAAHNMTVLSFAVLGLFILLEITKLSVSIVKKHIVNMAVNVDLKELLFLLKTGAVMCILAGPRMLYSVDYLHSYPRDLATSEASPGILKALFAMFGPVRQFQNTPSLPVWSWQEASAYIGIATGLAAIVCAMAMVKSHRDKKSSGISPALHPLIISGFGALFFLTGLGTFAGELSPFSILKHLPVFSDMRVATRWFVWSSIMVLIFIAVYTGNRWRRLIDILLAISVIELFVVNMPQLTKPYVIHPRQYAAQNTLNQQARYDIQREGIPYDENLTATTKSNIGQVIAGDALIDTRFPPPWGTNTIRCDSDKSSCSFVMTKNAVVEKWTPNYIRLRRTDPGAIELNMNPGKYWTVNNSYPFSGMRQAETEQRFLLSDNSKVLELRIQPKFSLGWWWNKLTN